MRFPLFAFAVFLFSTVYAQDKHAVEFQSDYKRLCRSSFPKVQLRDNNADAVAAYLLAALETLRFPDSHIQLRYANESPGGFHYSFIQTYKGVEVYQSEIKVNVDRRGVIRSVFDNSFNTRLWKLDVNNAYSNNVIAMHPETRLPVVAELRIVNAIEQLVFENEVIYERDTRSYLAPPDSLVAGKIFNPDPLTSAQLIYTPGTYHDNNNANAPWLDNELKTVNFFANFNGSLFTLENAYVKIADVDSPKVFPATSAIPQFFYNRSQTGFEDVNTFYHLTAYRNYVHSLGFTIADHLVTADPHAFSGLDQSAFSPNGGSPQLLYGIGGVDDAEDADVIVHEYAHFLSYNAAPGSNIGSQRNSLDEAFGDYLAASYSVAISTFNKDWVFNWDGPPWSGINEGGRTVASNKVYPADLVSSIYKNAPIWSTALMNIHNEIGRAATDSLIFQAHFSYASNISMADAALLLIDADTLLNNGSYYCPIYKHLLNRGLVPFYTNNPCGISSIGNSELLTLVEFMQHTDGFSIRNNTQVILDVNVYSITGQLVTAFKVPRGNQFYSSDGLPKGIYVIEAQSANYTYRHKWIKL
ncbi:MAG: T9SS type A sorting domain-containing protein [Chitinophagales bacterium]|nr:T9SS type A sorting domain-containing protein [Chitinophagales bacterium]